MNFAEKLRESSNTETAAHKFLCNIKSSCIKANGKGYREYTAKVDAPVEVADLLQVKLIAEGLGCVLTEVNGTFKVKVSW